MNIAALLAMLVQVGICAPVQFDAQGAGHLTVLVCPMLQPASPAEVSPDSPPAKLPGTPA